MKFLHELFGVATEMYCKQIQHVFVWSIFGQITLITPGKITHVLAN